MFTLQFSLMFCAQSESAVDPSDLFDDADDGLLLDAAANESDAGGSIPGIDTDIDDEDNDDDNASTADSIKPASLASVPPGLCFFCFLILIDFC